MWLNEHDVQDAVRYVENPYRSGDEARPNLTRAAKTLEALVEWTNSNSDGWPYWPKPSRASAKLQELVDKHVLSRAGRTGDLGDITSAQLKAALTPIKAFLTRQGVAHSEVIR